MYINNSILKDIRQLKILRTWIKKGAYSFVKTCVNLVFKSSPVFIDILDNFCHSLFTFLPFDYWDSTEFEFDPVPLRCFIKTSQILMSFNILFFLIFLEVFFFFKFSASKCSYYVLFSMKHSYILTAKTTCNNSL